MHKWQKDIKLLLPQCLVFLKLYCILRRTQLCPDRDAFILGWVRAIFLHFPTRRFPLRCACHMVPTLSQPVIQQWFVQAGAQELPNKLLPVLVCSSPGHREKGSTMEAPRTQPPSAVTAIQSKHRWQPRAQPAPFWASATTICFEFIHRTLSPTGHHLHHTTRTRNFTVFKNYLWNIA